MRKGLEGGKGATWSQPGGQGQCAGRPGPPHGLSLLSPPLPVSPSAKQCSHLWVCPLQTSLLYPNQNPTVSLQQALVLVTSAAPQATQALRGMNEPGKEGTPISHLHKGESLSLSPAPVPRQSQPPAAPLPRQPTLLSQQGTLHSPQEGPFHHKPSNPIQILPDRRKLCVAGASSPKAPDSWLAPGKSLRSPRGCADGGGSGGWSAAGYPLCAG